MQFLNKLYVKGIFSDASELNVVAGDLGEGMMKVAIQDDIVKRLPTATGTVGSLSIFVPVEVEIEILKTSPLWETYMSRCFNNGYIGGTFTLYDDVNLAAEISEVSLSLREIPNFNGTNAAVTFVVQGNLNVNRDALIF